jgi:probable F420-dependent oxidoreductase
MRGAPGGEAVQFGVSLFPTDYSITPAEAAKAAEAVGLSAIFFPEHTHMPVATRFPIAPEVPRHYKSTLDPFVALGSAASVTSTIRLGTGIALIPQRDPFTLAKEVATLDYLSGGRVILGIGAGWNEPETRNHGTPFEHRFRIMRERVEAMKALWTQDEAEYHGRFVDFGPTWSWPKPVQKPHPPIIIGGTGPHILKRIVAYGDGWMPIVGQIPFEQLAAQITELDDACAAAARPRPMIVVFGVPLDPEEGQKYAEAGVDLAVWGLESAPADVVLPQIERYGQAIRAYEAAGIR